MIGLLGSVLCTSLFLVIFKYFARFKVHLFPAIVFNYITCFIVGNIHLGNDHLLQLSALTDILNLRIAPLGLFFVGSFYAMGISTKMAGAGATSVAAKMSVVIPAIFALLVWHEPFSAIQYLGMALSLISVYLVSPDTPEEHKKHRGLWVLFIVFIGSGLVDTGLNFIKHDYGKVVSDQKISTLVFGGAALLGSIILVFNIKKHIIGMKEIAGGVILGITNYLSLIAMFAALKYFEGRTILYFAINNIGVVILSTVLGVVIFKEKIYRPEKLGLLLAVIAIILMNIHAFF
jgi:drug/metabolite transporter (DMT)-like permease